MIDLSSYTRANRPYGARGAALTAWRSARREVLMAGPAGTGKTRLWCEKLHHCCGKYPGMRALMVRKTRQSLSQTAMVTYEQKVLPDGWMDNIIHFNTTDQQYEYPNGSIIAVGGLDKPSKVMGSDFDFIFVPEATELFEDDWQSLTTRLRNNVMPYQQLGADCNPSYPTHWLKRRCDRMTTMLLTSKHEDNPSVTKEYLETLQALTGVLYWRLYKGLWVAAEGMVFPEWDRSIHVASTSKLIGWGVLTRESDEGEVKLNRRAVNRVVAGVDWGFRHPGCIQAWAIGNERMYQVREIYRTQRTIDWWIAEAKKLDKEFDIEVFICDPSEPSYIQQFRDAGLNAIGATNDIAPGLSAMRERLKVQPDGRAGLYIYEYALQERDELRDQDHLPTCFEQEIDAYEWAKAKDGQVQEVPVKLHDHSIDPTRYVCLHLAEEFGEDAPYAFTRTSSTSHEDPLLARLLRPHQRRREEEADELTEEEKEAVERIAAEKERNAKFLQAISKLSRGY